MSVSAFQAGAIVEFSRQEFKILRKISDSVWQLEECRTKRIFEFEGQKLRKMYTTGTLIFVPHSKPLNVGVPETEIGNISREIPEKDWETAKIRRAYVHAAIDLPYNKPLLQDAIQEVWNRIREPKEPPSPISVYRWKKRYLQAGRDIRSLAPQLYKSGNRNNRYPPEVESAVEKAISSKVLTQERGTIQDALDCATIEILRENKLRPAALQLPLPTRRLVKRIFSQVPAYDRYAARYGRMAATKKFRAVLAHRITQAPLERAEVDHTPLDLMVIDDDTGLPLGRPYLTVCLDDYTRCLLGLHIGFEPPSYLTVSSCLKHAFMPKANLRDKYPNLKNEWMAHGVMRELVVDNGAEFHSRGLENACFSLGIEVHYSARKTPWFKGKIERFQGTLNRAIAHGNPGTTFSNIFDKEDYEPSKNAVIRYSTLKEIVHIWVVDVYHQQPHRTIGAPPAVVWESSISNDEIMLPDNPAELDALMGRSVTRRLTHKGIELNGLKYNSHELTVLRRELGDSFDVELRIDDADLGKIVVFSPDKRHFFTVPSLSPDYAKGLSAWQHRICKKFAAKQLEKYDPEGWLEAKAEISRLIEEELMHKKQKSRTKIARFKANAQSAPATAELASPAAKATKRQLQPLLDAPEAPSASAISQPLTLSDIPPSVPARPAKRFKPEIRQRNPQALEAENADLPEAPT